ncbi:unnamed protein product [Notodromas monacha]|uniref:RRM domain-containing protein n=1 Tax=Notodromas monacha TaxID=399045 RepID=A0A7R9GDL2_9CRUS|nr:unnamed protein product [Notodromas monacha]CAG0918654.1 unnamed protein product [Notodromas monacha]
MAECRVQSALMIRNFPNIFTAEDAVNLLKYFGAVSVKTWTRRGQLEALADFRSEAETIVSLLRLHQQFIGGRRLRAVFASPSDTVQSENSGNEVAKDVVQGEIPCIQMCELDVDANECVPQLSKVMLLRIANAIAKHERFYRAVLALMRKLGFPNPSEIGHDLFDDVDLEPLQQTLPQTEGDEMDVSSGSDEESELEDEPGEAYTPHVIPSALPKRSSKSTTSSRRKRVKNLLKAELRQTETAVEMPNPGKRKSVPAETLFDSVKRAKTEIFVTTNLRLPDAGSDINSHANEDQDAEGFGSFGNSGKDESGSDEFFTRKYILKNRIAEKDFSQLAPFKNYVPGDPVSRLYIKNLPKNCTEEDVRKVFGAYVDWSNAEEAARFDLKVLKEGRMKGQAFVSMPSVETAETARRETNGFSLKGKSIVVCFARSGKPVQ